MNPILVGHFKVFRNNFRVQYDNKTILFIKCEAMAIIQ